MFCNTCIVHCHCNVFHYEQQPQSKVTNNGTMARYTVSIHQSLLVSNINAHTFQLRTCFIRIHMITVPQGPDPVTLLERNITFIEVQWAPPANETVINYELWVDTTPFIVSEKTYNATNLNADTSSSFTVRAKSMFHLPCVNSQMLRSVYIGWTGFSVPVAFRTLPAQSK
jgi:hypothetical protein